MFNQEKDPGPENHGSLSRAVRTQEKQFLGLAVLL